MNKLIRIETRRGRKVLVRPEDLQIHVCADGFIRAWHDFGPIVERVLPSWEAASVACGEAPEQEEA